MNMKRTYVDPIEIYKKVLDNKSEQFPMGFWLSETIKQDSLKIFKWLIEERMKWGRDDICDNISLDFVKKYKLTTPILLFYGGSVIELIEELYPRKFKPWEFKLCKVKKGYWAGDNGMVNSVNSIKWLIEDKLKIKKNKNKILKLHLNDFIDNGLMVMMRRFNGSVYHALEAAYPGKYKPWEFDFKHKGIWSGVEGKRNAKQATLWMIEDKLKLNYSQMYDITVDDFKKCGLGGMLNVVYGNVIFDAINTAYPDKFNAWEFRKIPKGYWDDLIGIFRAIEATKWLIEKKLLYTDNLYILHRINKSSFRQNGLGGMLKKVFNNDYIMAIQMSYPNKFKREDFKYIQEDDLYIE